MCGLTGLLYRDGTVPSATEVQTMTERVTHRGPDAGGVLLFPQAALGHRRLAVIDLSDASAQPMHVPGQAAISFNGEVYNFKELRAQLEALGHPFRSAGDTEVVLRGYLQWGLGVAQRLDGMFAFALWDERERRLVVARDRTGKKPLYVYDDDRVLLVASELKSILAHPRVDATPAPAALPQFLTHGYVPTPGTFYARIRKLPPGAIEAFPLQGRSTGPRVYWRYPVTGAPDVTVADAAAEVRRLFLRAVERRLVSDVPLGAFLSGGVDSTLVVGAMASLMRRPVRTFSIGFEDQAAWDETHYARVAARRFGTEHTEFKVRPTDLDLFDDVAWFFDEPFGDSSAIPTFIVAALTRQHVTVALTGDGGDEVFAGYPRFVAGAAMELAPGRLRRLAGTAAKWLPEPARYDSRRARCLRLAAQSARPPAERLRRWLTIFNEEELKRLLPPSARITSEAELGQQYAAAAAEARDTGPLNQLLHVNARTYLLEDLNVKVDRASMGASLETRSPFLDTALIEYVFRLPGHFKVRGFTTKWILKKAFADLLPREIARRPKMGFGLPLSTWMKGELRGFVRERLLAPRARLYEHLERSAVESIVNEHETGQRDRSYQLWCLLMLELWLRRPSGTPAGDPAQRVRARAVETSGNEVRTP